MCLWRTNIFQGKSVQVLEIFHEPYLLLLGSNTFLKFPIISLVKGSSYMAIWRKIKEHRNDFF